MTRLTPDEIRGIMPPVVTPFTEDEELDLDALRAEIEYVCSLDVGAVLVGAATGEGYALTADESAAAYRVAVQEVDGRVPVLAGVLCTSTRDAIRRAAFARDAGADAVMLTPVFYFGSSADGIVAHYRELAEQAQIPIMIYNAVPHNPIAPDVMRRLVEIEQVVAIKQGLGGTLPELRQLVEEHGDRVAVTWSQDALLYQGYCTGARGSLASIDAVVPELTIGLFDAVQRGDLPAARDLDQRIGRLVRSLGGADWPAAVKAAIELQGRSVGRARRPYVAVDDARRSEIRRALQQAGAIPTVAA